MNKHDANKHGLKDKCEWMHVGMNNGVHTMERGDVREERTTHICEASSLSHAHLLMTHVNSAMARTVSGNDYTIVTTPVAPLQLYEWSQHHPQSHWPQRPSLEAPPPHQTLHPPTHTILTMPLHVHTHIYDDNRNEGNSDNEKNRKEDGEDKGVTRRRMAVMNQ
jgi:hypothetical protein